MQSAPPFDAQAQIKRQNRFGFTVKNKQADNNELQRQIGEYLQIVFELELPDTKNEFNRMKPYIYQYGVLGTWLEERCSDLVNLYYALGETKGYYATFESEGKHKLQALAFWYSKHRLDAVWNWRKSQIIRNKYYNFLSEARNEYGVLLLDYYKPVHLVLTVPHQGGIWQSKRFYARELITAFNLIRKSETWRKYVYAGEYGIEVKRSDQHGLHIHMHSFLLQNPSYTVNEARAEIEKLWRTVTGNQTGYSGLHYETLYTWKKDKAGKTITDANGVPVKKYIRPGKSDLNEYLNGVMECIKYHFKPDCLESKNGGGEYDMELIDEILINTRGLRMYSRYGAFYRQPLLNFNNLVAAGADEEQITVDEETGECEVSTTTAGVEQRVVNPFTGVLATADEYEIAICKPTQLKYHQKDSETPYEPYLYRGQRERLICFSGIPLKEIIRLDLTGKLRGMIEDHVYKESDNKRLAEKQPDYEKSTTLQVRDFRF